MSTRHIVVLCEGPHDVSFLRSVLKANGCIPLKKVIKDLDAPWNAFFLKRLQQRNTDSAQFKSQDAIIHDETPTLVAGMMTADEKRVWYFLACVGDSQNTSVPFLKTLLANCAPNLPPEHRLANLGVVIVNDADRIGIDERLKDIKNRYGEVVMMILPEFDGVPANGVIRGAEFGAGTCIFAKPGVGLGTLEDIIFPMLQEANPSVMEDATEFINKHPTAKPAKKLKAIITVAGQPENPGFALSVILRDNPYLKDEVLKASPLCQQYLKVLMDV